MGERLLNKCFHKWAIYITSERNQRYSLIIGIPSSFIFIFFLLSPNPPIGFTIAFAILGFGNLIGYLIIKWIKYKNL